MKNAVQYKNTWLMKNSMAYQLWEVKDFAKLDKHLKEVDNAHRELLSKCQSKLSDQAFKAWMKLRLPKGIVADMPAQVKEWYEGVV